MKYPILTYKIITLDEVETLDVKDCVQWAQEVLALGIETEHVLILSACGEEDTWSEIKDYVVKSLNELNLDTREGSEALCSYAYCYVLNMSKGVDVRINLERVYEVFQLTNFDEKIYDFYKLRWAWDDIDNEPDMPNYYWPEADRSNINDVTIEVSKKWIQEFEKRLSL